MKTFYQLGAMAAMVFVAASANATTIKSSYTVNANQTDPGLVIQTADRADNPFTHDLSSGQSVTFGLFDIWTNEGSVNGDDRSARPISVDFDFLLPEMGTSTVNGETDGVSFLGLFEKGVLTWDENADFFFGPNHDGQIQISLSDEKFNKGFFGLNEGRHHGATVEATLSLVSDASAADVPEPGMLGLFALALLGMGYAATRRRNGNLG